MSHGIRGVTIYSLYVTKHGQVGRHIFLRCPTVLTVFIYLDCISLSIYLLLLFDLNPKLHLI